MNIEHKKRKPTHKLYFNETKRIYYFKLSTLITFIKALLKLLQHNLCVSTLQQKKVYHKN
jgi:hypothetical protein